MAKIVAKMVTRGDSDWHILCIKLYQLKPNESNLIGLLIDDQVPKYRHQVFWVVWLFLSRIACSSALIFEWVASLDVRY